MIGAELLRYNLNQRYALFDAETFNLNLMTDNPPWQFSWILGNKDIISEEQDHFLNWKGRFFMSRDAARITGYSEDKINMVGRDPEEVWNEFEQVLLDDSIILCGHNIINFDLYIINQWARYLGKKPIYNIRRVLDTNCLAKMMKLGVKPDRGNFIQQQYKLAGYRAKGVKTSLGVLAKEFGIVVDDSKLHNAIYDLGVNYQVLQKLLWSIEI
jgi:DNA polymerase III epsilon subunit-like protein